jgi:hypothetical protein
MRRKRPIPSSLSLEERRVLDAFFCGHLPAGRLSVALAEARRRAGRDTDTGAVARQAVDAPAPAAAPAPLRAAA